MSSESLRSNQDSEHGGFTKLPCAVCQRTTWHYRPRGSEESWSCGSHSNWPNPSMRRFALPADAIVQAGSLRKPYKMPAMRRDRRGVVKQTTRVRRGCGCWVEVNRKQPCPACLQWLRATRCKTCAGYAIPLPKCGCEAVYTHDEQGQNVTVQCGRCSLPVRVWDSRKVLIGRWIRVPKVIRHLPDGTEEIEMTSIPRVKLVDGCQECQEAFAVLVALTEELNRQTGKNRPAFLPLM